MTRAKGWVAACLIAASVALGPRVGRASAGEHSADEPGSYASLAVQNRRYFMRHELSLAVGLLPMDAFTKGLTASGGYTLHFDTSFAWEIAHFFYSFPLDTGLKGDLDAFDLRPTPFEVLKMYLSSNFVWKPIYWKGAFLNDSLVHGELMLTAGGGYGWFTRSSRPMVNYGAGIRLFLTRVLSARLDVRHMMFFTYDAKNGLGLHNELWLGLGASLGF